MTDNEGRMLLSVEITADGEGVEIHGNQKGFDFLLDRIKRMSLNGNDHIHLLSREYGGEDLSDELIGQGNRKVGQVKVLFWS